MARFDDIYERRQHLNALGVINCSLRLSCSLPRQSCCQAQPVQESLAPRPPESNISTHEWEAVRVSGRCLNQEFVSPAVERVETL